MGMLATIMNSLTLADALRRLKVNARVLSAVSYARRPRRRSARTLPLR